VQIHVIAEPASVDVVPDRLPVEPQDLHDLANRQELVGHDAGQTDGSLHDRLRPDGEGVQLVVDLLTIAFTRIDRVVGTCGFNLRPAKV
jgi:hypothetical protein